MSDYEERKKRERFPNFSVVEQNILIDLINKYRKILDNKRSNAVSWHEKKKTWDKILLEFESAAGVKRSAKNLRDKYENLKKLERKDRIELNGECAKEQRMSVRTAALLDTPEKPFQLDNQAPAAPTDASSAALLDTTSSASNDLHWDSMPDNIQLKKENSVDLVNGNDLRMWANESIPNFTSWSQYEEDQHHINDDILRAKFTFYKNNDIRAQEKHEAEMREMALKLKILEAELKIKELTAINLNKQSANSKKKCNCG